MTMNAETRLMHGIAVAILELKRSVVAVAEGIRQNLDSQKRMFIEHFFSTMQLVMAGNDSEGLRYATIQTPEKYYLTWKEEGAVENPLDRSILQICRKDAAPWGSGRSRNHAPVRHLLLRRPAGSCADR